jgi:hypothetical protein
MCCITQSDTPLAWFPLPLPLSLLLSFRVIVYDGQPGVESYARTPQVQCRHATTELIPDQSVKWTVSKNLLFTVFCPMWFCICDDNAFHAASAMLLILATPLPCRSISSPPNPSTGRLYEPLFNLFYLISTSFVPSWILTVSHSLFGSLYQHQYRH